MDKCPPLGSFSNKSPPPRLMLGCKSPQGGTNFLCKSLGVPGSMVMDEIDMCNTFSIFTLFQSKICSNSFVKIMFNEYVQY